MFFMVHILVVITYIASFFLSCTAAVRPSVSDYSKSEASVKRIAGWDRQTAEEKYQIGYNALYPYLNDCLCKELSSDAFDWVIEQSKKGDVVCAYLHLRNSAYRLSQPGVVFSTEEMKELLMVLTICLARISLDTIMVNILFGRTCSSYDIFLRKFRDDLFKNMIPLFEKISFQETLDNVLMWFADWFNQSQEEQAYPAIWVSTVGWKGLGRWGIAFKPLDQDLLLSYRGFMLTAQSNNMHPSQLGYRIIAYVITSWAAYTSWCDFLYKGSEIFDPKSLVDLKQKLTTGKDVEDIVQGIENLGFDIGAGSGA